MTPVGFPQFPKTQDSEVFWANNEIITTARCTITGSGNQLRFFVGTSPTLIGTFAFEELSGINPAISPNVITHTLTATDGKFIKWKAVGLNYTITEIQIRVN